MNAVVTLTVESTHTYYLPNVASLEDAEAIAEALLLDDGEEGDDVEREVVDVESCEDDEEPEEN